jgi:hypothetical protein
MEKNRGFEMLYGFFFDALVSKTGYVKAYWEKTTEKKKETYTGLSEEELALILEDDEVKPIAHSMYADEVGNVYHDLQIEVEDEFGRVHIEGVSPEDLLIGYGVTGATLRDADFVEQRSMLTLSQLREMGFDVDDDIQGDDQARYEQESLSRDNYGENAWTDITKGANRRVLVKEVYIKLDRNEDGISELWRFVIVGSTILDECECESIPYASICPVPMPHRHVGLSYVDLVKDLQLIKSTLLRNALDAQYQSIHGRFAISDKVNLDDMLVSRTGGIVRVDGDPSGAIMPLSNPVDGTRNLNMMEYIDEIRQFRTGVTDASQGMDVNSLNKTKGGTQMLMSAAQSRIEMVARIFAETGVKDLFLLVHELVRKHSNREEIFRLRQKWVAVDPRTWETRKDMTVSVGLGTGNKDQMLQHLQTILLAQQQAIQIGVATPKNIYNALVKLTQNAGFKEPEEFWTDPEAQNAQGQQKGPSDAEIKAQSDMQQAQMDNQTKQGQIMADMQLQRERMAQEIQMEREKMVKEISIAREKMLGEMQIKRESMAGEMQMAREQIIIDAANRQQVDTKQGIEGA